jgi:glycosyltransferase involved in cell wall biosynthesis
MTDRMWLTRNLRNLTSCRLKVNKKIVNLIRDTQGLNSFAKLFRAKHPKLFSILATSIFRVENPQMRTFSEINKRLWVDSGENLKTGLIVIRDLPMKTRSGAFLRITNLAKLFQKIGIRIEFHVLNGESRTCSLWKMSREDYLVEQLYLLNEGFGISYSDNQSDFYLDFKIKDFEFVWMHDIWVARDFLSSHYLSCSFKSLILDTVDLEFRRFELEGKFSLARQSMKTLRSLVKLVDRTIVVTNQEKMILEQILDGTKSNLEVIGNIYNTEDYKSLGSHDKDYDAIFVGNFLHYPNLDAVNFILNEMVSEGPDLKIAIAGPCLPENVVERLKNLSNISYHGHVEDLKPLYSRSCSVIAPLSIGAGIKGKVLEGLLLGMPVIGSEIAFEGIPVQDLQGTYVAFSGKDYVDAINKAKVEMNSATENLHLNKAFLESLGTSTIEDSLRRMVQRA